MLFGACIQSSPPRLIVVVVIISLVLEAMRWPWGHLMKVLALALWKKSCPRLYKLSPWYWWLWCCWWWWCCWCDCLVDSSWKVCQWGPVHHHHHQLPQHTGRQLVATDLSFSPTQAPAALHRCHLVATITTTTMNRRRQQSAFGPTLAASIFLQSNQLLCFSSWPSQLLHFCMFSSFVCPSIC